MCCWQSETKYMEIYYVLYLLEGWYISIWGTALFAAISFWGTDLFAAMFCSIPAWMRIRIGFYHRSFHFLPFSPLVTQFKTSTKQGAGMKICTSKNGKFCTQPNLEILPLARQVNALLLAISISSHSMGVSTPFQQRVSTSLPRVATQGSSQSPSRMPLVELWVNCMFDFSLLVQYKENSVPSLLYGSVVVDSLYCGFSFVTTYFVNCSFTLLFCHFFSL